MYYYIYKQLFKNNRHHNNTHMSSISLPSSCVLSRAAFQSHEMACDRLNDRLYIETQYLTAHKMTSEVRKKD